MSWLIFPLFREGIGGVNREQIIEDPGWIIRAYTSYLQKRIKFPAFIQPAGFSSGTFFPSILYFCLVASPPRKCRIAL